MSVAIVVVSHSEALANAAVALSREMAPADRVRIEVAAGTDDGGVGTDATRIVSALEACGADLEPDGDDGVLVLLDLGSAVLSTETALDLLDDLGEGELRSRVRVSPAPLVEGLVVAAVAAAGGASLAAVATEAEGALAAKTAHLGEPAAPPAASDATDDTAPAAPDGDAVTATFRVSNAHGLHARPAARLVTEVTSHDAEVTLRNVTSGAGPEPGDSMLHVALLGAEHGAEVEIVATGPDARAVVDAVVALAADRFGDDE